MPSELLIPSVLVSASRGVHGPPSVSKLTDNVSPLHPFIIYLNPKDIWPKRSDAKQYYDFSSAIAYSESDVEPMSYKPNAKHIWIMHNSLLSNSFRDAV